MYHTSCYLELIVGLMFVVMRRVLAVLTEAYPFVAVSALIIAETATNGAKLPAYGANRCWAVAPIGVRQALSVLQRVFRCT
eukprot:COSAG02_NODE_4705_length_5075_cov_2.069534_4_plen_81_part_00